MIQRKDHVPLKHCKRQNLEDEEILNNGKISSKSSIAAETLNLFSPKVGGVNPNPIFFARIHSTCKKLLKLSQLIVLEIAV